MKRFFRSQDKFIVIQTIMNNYPDAFEGKTNAIAYRDSFIANNERMSELITALDKPYTEYYTRKREEAARLLMALKDAIKLGISVAKKLQDNTMLQALKSYRDSLWHISYHSLPEMSLRVLEALGNNMEEALAWGMTEEKYTELQNLTNSFREIMQSTSFDMSSRKTARRELNSLIKANNDNLAYYIDSFVANQRLTFPAFYNAYITERMIKRRKRKAAGETSLCEITGTVTNSVTKLPLANAVINLLTPETIVTTDEDGVYVIEDLEAGEYTVSCHIEGYEVPAGITVTAVAGDSLVVDFALVPAQQQEAA